MKLIVNMPKAENHIHIEGSIPFDLALKLADKNKVELPYDNVEEIRKWVLSRKKDEGLKWFMFCNRTINSVCLHEEDYEEVILTLARDAKKQNIIYQEFHLDYQLNGERGIPLEVVMEGYRSGRDKAKKMYGVDIVYIVGLDRTLSAEKCTSFVKSLEKYLDMIEGIGMDCEEIGHPCKKHALSYELAGKMGLFKTAHAGEDSRVDAGYFNIWDAINILKVDRIDHGCWSVEDPKLLEYLAENKILCAMCPTANIGSGNAKSYEEHPIKIMLRQGIPCTLNSDDPPYSGELVQEYGRALDLMKLTEDELILLARNAFTYSIRGQKYLEVFDKWIKDWKAGNI